MSKQMMAKLIAAQEIGRTLVQTYYWNADGDPVVIVGIKPENDTFIPLSAHSGENDERRVLWHRRDDNNRPEMVDIDDEVMIAVMNRERTEVVALIFLGDELDGARRHEAQRLAQKQKAAAYFGVERYKLDRQEHAVYLAQQEAEGTVTVAVTHPPKASKRPPAAPANPVMPADVAAQVATTTTPALDPEEPIRRELLERTKETVYRKEDGAPLSGIPVIAGDHLRVLPDGTECVKLDERGNGQYFVVRGGKQRDHVQVTSVAPGTAIEGTAETAPKQQLH